MHEEDLSATISQRSVVSLGKRAFWVNDRLLKSLSVEQAKP